MLRRFLDNGRAGLGLTTLGLSLACLHACGGDLEGVAGVGGRGGNASVGGALAQGASSTVEVSTGATAGGAIGTSSAASSQVAACLGVVTTADAVHSAIGELCGGMGIECEPLPTDLILLVDRSVSNGYAVGTDYGAVTPSSPSRWSVLTDAMGSFVATSNAEAVGASLTFSGFDGSDSEGANCVATNYERPAVAFASMADNGSQLVAKMAALNPSGQSPTVPALEGTFRYAMSLQADDRVRLKALVLISDGTVSQCEAQSSADVAQVIREAATATVPVRTFVVGLGSPNTLARNRADLVSYAEAGRTGDPYLIDETAGIEGIKAQFATAFRDILRWFSRCPMVCEYELDAPGGASIDTSRVALTYQPTFGDYQQIPLVSGEAACSASAYGGFYFDNAISPTKVTVCPCTCANFGDGSSSVFFGCKSTIP